MTDKSILHPEHLRKLISYDPDTGALTWLPRTVETWPDKLAARPQWQCNNWNSAHAGKKICHQRRDGYIMFQIRGKQYRAHRAAWAIYFGEWPDSTLDHINGFRDDNRLCNLRLVTDVENARNCKIPSNNTSGAAGVSWSDVSRKWSAYIGKDGKKLHLGFFRTFDEAVACRSGAEKALGYSRRHGQSLNP